MTIGGNIEVIHRPYENLTDKEIKELVKGLTEIARDGFGTEITEEDVENHVLKTDEVYLFKPDDVAGFSSFNKYKVLGHGVLYLNGIVVKRKYQKNGFFYKANSRAIKKNKPDIFITRTQNPVVYGAPSSRNFLWYCFR